jgi:type I restriction enzyme S subunit
VPAIASPTTALKSIKIPLPPLNKQKAIAKILFDLDSKIELNQKMNKTLEAIAQAIFKHWFINFEFPNEEGKPYKSSGGETVDSELGEIPKGWNIRKLGDLGKIVCGKTPSTKDETNFGQDVPFITIPDMRGNVFTFKTERYLSTKGANSQETKFLPPLSVCVSCIATPGLVTLTSTTSQTNQQINSIICKEGLSPFFVYFVSKEKSQEIIYKGLGGTATLNLNTSEFSNLKVILPDLVTLKNFHDFTTQFFKKILNNSKEILVLFDIRDSLLPRLMTGKIRVPLEE